MKIHTFLCTTLLLCINTYILAQHPLAPRDDEQVRFDIYSGTIREQDKILYLQRCDAIQYEHPINFYRAQDEQRIRELLNTKESFWVEVSVGIYKREEIYHLHIGAILEERKNVDCAVWQKQARLAREE